MTGKVWWIMHGAMLWSQMKPTKLSKTPAISTVHGAMTAPKLLMRSLISINKLISTASIHHCAQTVLWVQMATEGKLCSESPHPGWWVMIRIESLMIFLKFSQLLPFDLVELSWAGPARNWLDLGRTFRHVGRTGAQVFGLIVKWVGFRAIYV